MNYSEIILIAVTFIVAVVNTSVGPTGGFTFAAIASVLPIHAVIPVHAGVTTAGSVLRWVLLREYVDLRFVFPFAIGGVLGAGIVWPFLELFDSEAAMLLLLGGFILWSRWLPMNLFSVCRSNFPLLGGATTSAISLFVGATSPLVTSLVSQHKEDHRQVLGTSTACLAIQHGIKLPLFGALGFSYWAYSELLVTLVVAATAGTFVGKRLLLHLSPTWSKLLFKMLMTALGIRLLYKGIIIQSWVQPVADWTLLIYPSASELLFSIAIGSSGIFLLDLYRQRAMKTFRGATIRN